MKGALRVLQAADLCLHEPLETIGRLPAPLREIFNQARERTAMKIFNAALTQGIDLLLLTGSLADCEAEPRLACFLMEQFRRLHLAGVHVVWATTQSSLMPIWSLRPEQITCLLPGQSAVIPTGSPSGQILIHHASSSIPTGRAATDFHADARDLVITVDTNAIPPIVEYIGPDRTRLLRHEILPVHHTNSAQRGPTGMRMNEFAPGEKPRSLLADAATVAWAAETIDLAEHRTRESLLKEMQLRSRCCHDADKVEMTCMEWIFSGTSPLWENLIGPEEPGQLIQELRQSLGRGSRIWNWKIHLHPSAEQYQRWSAVPAVAEGFRQLDQLSTSDLAASAHIPSSTGPFLRGPILTHDEFGLHRPRLVRELRTPMELGAGNIGNSEIF